jgi:hypothetical protein
MQGTILLDRRHVNPSTATKAPGGAITLYLRAELSGGGHGYGVLVYSPRDPRYREILRRLGGLHPGEWKPVRPWPDHPAPSG